jgi:flagellar biosynthesis protein FlhB
VIVTDLTSLCGAENAYAVFPDLQTAESLRHNVGSSYMFASVIYCLFLMLIVSCFNVVYISFQMKEHQVPLIFRNPDSSLYYDTQRAKNLFYVVFMILSGIMGSLNFFDVDAKCLHTYNEESFSSQSVDLF